MNGIIITGAPRSGKSTCIERLLNEEKGYAVVSGDSITVSLYYTENGKRKFSFGRKKTYAIFEKTVNEYQKIKVILDYHYIEIEKLLEYLKNNYKIIFFGYPNISSERLKQRIRRNENQNDWTNQLSNKELNYFIEKGISISKRDYLFCKQTGIPFIDTSYDLENAYYKLLKELKKSE